MSLVEVFEPTQGCKSFMCLGISSISIVFKLLIPMIFPTQYQVVHRLSEVFTHTQSLRLYAIRSFTHLVECVMSIPLSWTLYLKIMLAGAVVGQL